MGAGSRQRSQKMAQTVTTNRPTAEEFAELNRQIEIPNDWDEMLESPAATASALIWASARLLGHTWPLAASSLTNEELAVACECAARRLRGSR